MTENIPSQRVVISAAADGIGRAMAEAYLQAGAQVAVFDISPAAVNDFRDAHPDSLAEVVDVTDEAAVSAFFSKAQQHLGGIDVLVNNAGIAGPSGYIEDMALADWRRCMEVGVDGMFLCLKSAVPIMKKQKSGVITNLASTAGTWGYPMRTPYAAAKWAVVGLTKSLACELGEFGIRANAICPGAVAGDRMDRVIAAESQAKGKTEAEIRESYEGAVSMRSFVTQKDIADMALYLSSPAARMVSGQVIAVDGNTERVC